MRRVALMTAVGVVLGGGATVAQCTDPAFCGQWSNPVNPEETIPGTPTTKVEISCEGACPDDEIGHVTLIPVGQHKGRLLVWTAWDNRLARDVPYPLPYKSYIIDPASWSVVESMSFDTALPPLAQGDGPFCTGQVWMTDSAGNPKYLLAGGIQHVGGFPASKEAYWFDPLKLTGEWWIDGPPELLEPLWYPSVITYLDSDSNRYRPLVVGGSSYRPPVCNDLYNEWWTLSFSPDQWNEYTGNVLWEGYPRTFFLAEGTDPYLGEVLSAGHDTICPDGPFVYGANPCNVIKTASSPQTWEVGPNPNDICDEDLVGCDPDSKCCIWRWNSNHGALLHTLKSTWAFTTDEDAAIAMYDLNRVFMTGGNKEEPLGSYDPGMHNAYAHTLEYTGNSWVKVPEEPEPRVFANFTLLPDGTILLLGGQNQFKRGGSSTNVYRTTANRFDPDPPLGQPAWKTLAKMRPFDGVASEPMPRGYHSVSILLPDGSVALMGGIKDGNLSSQFPDADSSDSVDHFQPPYFFNGARPVMGQVPATIQYGKAFTVRVLNGASSPSPNGPPVPIVRFCLIGLGSVTHHFDYGQRYIELLYEDLNQGKKRILAPPKACMAPDGYYLLFAVDSLGRPTKGEFVRLTF